MDNEAMIDICYNAHVRGFEKGYKYRRDKNENKK